MTIFEAVKKQVDIIEVYNELTGYNETNFNKNVRCPSPGHNDKTPSCRLYPETNSFHCFSLGCNAGGSVIDMVREVNGASGLEAARWLAERYNVEYEDLTPEVKEQIKKRQSRKELMKRFIEKSHNRLTPEHRQLLYSRGLSDNTIDKYKIGYCPKLSKKQIKELKINNPKKFNKYKVIGLLSDTDYFLPGERIIIPFWRYKDPLYWTGWDNNQKDFKYLNPAGLKKPVIFHIANNDSDIYITEGVFDFYSLVEAGMNVIAVLGSKTKDTIINKLQRMKGKKMHIAFDNDVQENKENPGQEAAEKLSKSLWPDIQAEIITFPPNKDVNDLFQESSGNRSKFKQKLSSLSRETILDRYIKKVENKSTENGKMDAASDVYPLIGSLNDDVKKEMAIKRLQEALGGKEAVSIKSINKTIAAAKEKPSTNNEDDEEEPDFVPTVIGENIIKIEEARGRYWQYSLEKELLYLYDNNEGVWRMTKEAYLQKIIRKELINITAEWDKKYYINEVLQAIKDILIDPVIDIRFNPGASPVLTYINLKNGMLDWKNKKLREHNKDYYSLFQLPVEYDPDKGCPNWEKTLKEWVPEAEARKFIQEYVGYCLIPDTSQHKAVILHGTGSNGKSTFLNVLNHFFGKQNLSNIPLHRLSERFETANIQDKLINICSDIDPTYLKETGIIKTIIAGEPLRGEYKYGASFDFTPVVRLIFSANEIPKARDKTEAWYRRFEIVTFPNKFTKDDPGFDPYLEDKLIEELPGVFNWALVGLQRLMENRRFTESKALQIAKREYERENDTITAFLEDKTFSPADNYIPVKQLWNEYKNYCEETELKPQSRRTFTSKIKTEGFKYKQKWIDGKNQRCFYGMTLLSEQTEEDITLNDVI